MNSRVNPHRDRAAFLRYGGTGRLPMSEVYPSTSVVRAEVLEPLLILDQTMVMGIRL